LRAGRSRNVENVGDLMGMDMVLLDGKSSSSLEKYATLKQPMGGAISHDQSAHVNFYRGFHSFLTCDVCNDDKSARVVRCSTPHSLLH
ncbi:unnamed protein product, partial [Brassica oleracea var. botrytis]